MPDEYVEISEELKSFYNDTMDRIEKLNPPDAVQAIGGMLANIAANVRQENGEPFSLDAVFDLAYQAAQLAMGNMGPKEDEVAKLVKDMLPPKDIN